MWRWVRCSMAWAIRSVVWGLVGAWPCGSQQGGLVRASAGHGDAEAVADELVDVVGPAGVGTDDDDDGVVWGGPRGEEAVVAVEVATAKR